MQRPAWLKLSDFAGFVIIKDDSNLGSGVFVHWLLIPIRRHFIVFMIVTIFFDWKNVGFHKTWQTFGKQKGCVKTNDH